MSSLVVDTNLSALQALNDLNSTDNNLSTSIQRLSSGLKIQNAATGPAQYVISQALESQSNGYNTAISNAQNGVSLIQTAAGALSQISSILQTMDQLALTSANGATETTTALTANQTEFTDLQKSIDQIAKTTTFGTKQLLTGTFKNEVLQVGAFDNATNRINLTISAATTGALGLTGTGAKATSGAITLTTKKITTAAAVTIKVTLGAAGTTTNYTVKVTAGTYTLTQLATKVNSSAAGKVVTASVSFTTATDKKGKLAFTTVATGTSAKESVIATGTTATVTALGLKTKVTGTGASGGMVSITSVSKAQSAVATVQKAISTVDTIASKVGATQNELQAIVANLTVGQQNLQAANSQLVDVNMAQQMTTYSTQQILMQTGVAMLAQAQQAPSLVLKIV